ncbi:MAG: selenocysteine-specific translation elongation factor [Thermoleophilia bacterium]
MGTAGHIDHGKTALIKALTGIDTDRLKEEKERGISIELGYAELELPSGTHMSVIDVPGHERFVRNMVAGASGIDIFLLVVAADDGVMPQTREHMAIIRMLGIPQGVVAITKSDLVDEEMVELVTADIEEFLSGTPYEAAPLIPVSSKTGEGLTQLLGMLEDAAARAEMHQASPATRLPVDRVFTLKGIGTVVTGTLWAGSICAEDAIWLLPDGLAGRARTVQVHDRTVECAEAGQRAAINISGIDRDRFTRGQMIVKGEELSPTYMVDARITLLKSAPTLKYAAQTRFHHGTADATAKLMFADRDRLAPGETCFTQIRLKTRIVPARGDRFILRSLSPVTTIGGGTVIDPMPRKHGQGEEHVRRLQTLETGTPDEIVALFLEEAAPGGLTAAKLVARSQLLPGQVAAALENPDVAIGRVTGSTEIFFAPGWTRDFAAGAIAVLGQRQKDSPADPSLAADELAKQAGLAPGSRDFIALIGGLLAQNEVALKDNRYALASAEAKLSESQKRVMDALAGALVTAGLSPPSLPDLGKAAGAAPQELKLLMKLLVDGGQAVKVKPDLYFTPGPVAKARQAVIEKCQRDGQITLAEFRDISEISRKFAQALLEYFDRTGVTRREGDYRVLRKKATG